MRFICSFMLRYILISLSYVYLYTPAISYIPIKNYFNFNLKVIPSAFNHLQANCLRKDFRLINRVDENNRKCMKELRITTIYSNCIPPAKSILKEQFEKKLSTSSINYIVGGVSEELNEILVYDSFSIK